MALDTITASEEGGKRRRAEFVILEVLKTRGPSKLSELEEFVESIHENLLDSDFNSPFYFRGGGSNGPVSREFDSSIDRLLQYNRIEKNEDRKYAITDQGEEYLDNDSKLDRHNIDERWREFITRIISDF